MAAPFDRIQLLALDPSTRSHKIRIDIPVNEKTTTQTPYKHDERVHFEDLLHGCRIRGRSDHGGHCQVLPGRQGTGQRQPCFSHRAVQGERHILSLGPPLAPPTLLAFQVTVVDISQKQIDAWNSEELPIYEPELLEVMCRLLEEGLGQEERERREASSEDESAEGDDHRWESKAWSLAVASRCSPNASRRCLSALTRELFALAGGTGDAVTESVLQHEHCGGY